MEKFIVSKVLVLDSANTSNSSMKLFYDECGLVGIKPQENCSDVVTLLRSNVDLGGIVIYENYNGEGAGVSLARTIHNARPELPIFLRRDNISNVAGLEERDASIFRCAFTFADLSSFRASLEASIFSRLYPNDLVRGITEFTKLALETLFRQCEIEVATPYLIKDRTIFGEVFSMIAIESQWCRGYMMLQAEEDALLELISAEIPVNKRELTFREINNVLGEATNLIWGAFKNRYVSSEGIEIAPHLTQVPIIINHHRQYISFGSDDPQLCLQYLLHPANGCSTKSVSIYQRFVFNLNWAPEKFVENPSIDTLVTSGELELF